MPEADKQNKIKLQKEIEILKQQLEQAQTGIENIKKTPQSAFFIACLLLTSLFSDNKRLISCQSLVR